MGECLHSPAQGGEGGEGVVAFPGTEETLTEQMQSLRLQEAVQPESSLVHGAFLHRRTPNFSQS